MGKTAFLLEGIGSFLVVYLGAAMWNVAAVSPGSFQGIAYIYILFNLLGHKTNSGHCNPAVTLFKMITKEIDGKEGGIRCAIQIVAALIGGLCVMLLDPKNKNDGEAGNNVWYTAKLSELADTDYSALFRWLFFILNPLILGLTYAYLAKTKPGVIKTAFALIIAFLCIDVTSLFADKSGYNLLHELGTGFFLNYTEKFTSSDSFYLFFIGPLAGIIGGGCLGHFVFWKDGADAQAAGDNKTSGGDGANAKSIELQSGKQNIVMKQYGDEQ